MNPFGEWGTQVQWSEECAKYWEPHHSICTSFTQTLSEKNIDIVDSREPHDLEIHLFSKTVDHIPDYLSVADTASATGGCDLTTQLGVHQVPLAATATITVYSATTELGHANVFGCKSENILGAGALEQSIAHLVAYHATAIVADVDGAGVKLPTATGVFSTRMVFQDGAAIEETDLSGDYELQIAESHRRVREETRRAQQQRAEFLAGLANIGAAVLQEAIRAASTQSEQVSTGRGTSTAKRNLSVECAAEVVWKTNFDGQATTMCQAACAYSGAARAKTCAVLGSMSSTGPNLTSYCTVCR